MDFSEFLAEDEIIEIIPNFNFPRQMNLISGDFGPFHASVPVKVPLWMAINLNRQKKCTIIPPKWMSELRRYQEDQEKQETLSEIPTENWREILKILEEHTETAYNCSDLIERREAILRTSAHALFKHAYNSTSLVISDVSLHNVTKGELQLIKTIVVKAFSQLQKFRIIANQSK